MLRLLTQATGACLLMFLTISCSRSPENPAERPSDARSRAEESADTPAAPHVVKEAQYMSGAMEPTIKQGSTFRYEEIPAHRLNRWDVICLKAPVDSQALTVSRIVGLPGETIRIDDGKLFADGELIPVPDGMTLPLHSIDMAPDDPDVTVAPVDVPPESLYVIGDNSDRAVDSRSYGPVPFRNILGRVLLDSIAHP